MPAADMPLLMFVDVFTRFRRYLRYGSAPRQLRG